MASDSEKLSTILPYIRAMGEDVRRRLDRFRQNDGNGTSFAGFGYVELLDKIYELHLKYQKETADQCQPLKEKIRGIEEKLHEHCSQDITELVEKTLAGPKKL